MRATWLVCVLGSVAACGPQQGEPGGRAASAPAAELARGSEFDVSVVLDAARSRLRFEGERWVGSGRAHRLSVGADGARLTPVVAAGPGRGLARLAALSPKQAKAFFIRRADVAPRELTFRATSIARVGYECVVGEPALAAVEAGAERRFADCSERWENSATGVEHSVRFERAPSGSGDLVVEVAADAKLSPRVRTDARGVHFVFADGAGLRYGHGTWIDRAGKKTAVASRWAGDHIELRVPERVLAESRFPAVLDPDVGPEIGTDPPVYQPSDFGHNPELASDGSGFLSVQEVNARIRAVRVDGTGKLLDLNWLDLGVDGITQLYPSVVFGGGRYFVTWTELVNNAAGDSTMEVRGRFLKPDGTIEGSTSLLLSAGSAIYSSVGWDGSHFVLTYLGTSAPDGNAVHSVLLDANGSRVDGSDHVVTPVGSHNNPRLDVGAANTLLVWEDYTHSDVLGDVSTIKGVRIGRNGAVLDATPFVVSGGSVGENSPDVAAGSGGYLVAYQLADGSGVHASVVTDAGNVSTKDVVVSHGSEGAGLPSAVFDGTQYLVAWADGRDSGSLYGTRVSGSGAPSTSDTRLASDPPWSVGFGSDHTNLAWNGSHFFLSYLAMSPQGVEGALLRSDLSIEAAHVPLTPIPNSQGYPQLSFDGSNYVVAWTDRQSSDIDEDLRSVRISGAGVVLDPAGIAVSTPEQPAFGFALGSSGGSTLFAWSGAGAPTSRRSLSNAGTLGAVAPLTTQHPMSSFGLASNGQGYLVAFNSGDSSETGVVYGHLLDPTGSSGNDFRLDASTLNTGPFVFPSEGGYLVAYARAGMHLVRISATGTVGAPLDLVSDSVLVSAATSGASTLITWSDSFGSDSPLRARLLRAGAYVGEPIEISASSAGYGSALAWDGTSYWAVWESPTHHLSARSISETGALGTAADIVDEEVYAPALASDGAGQMLLSYAKLVGERRSYRVASRLLGRGAIGSGTAGSGGTSSNGTSSGGTNTTTSGGATNGGATSAGGAVTTSAGTGNGGSNGSVNSSGGTNAAGSPTAGASTTASGGASNAAGSSATSNAGGGDTQPGGPLCSVEIVGKPTSAWPALSMLGLALFGRARRRAKP